MFLTKFKNNAKKFFLRFWPSLLVIIIAYGLLFGSYFYIKWYCIYKYDQYRDTLFFAKTNFSPCTHDLSYQEPVVPNGKYYPNGDISAPYYVEITEYKYWEMISSDGKIESLISLVENNGYDSESDSPYKLSGEDLSHKYRGVGNKVEFKVITEHATDFPMMYINWHRTSAEEIEDIGYHPGSPYMGSLPISRIIYSEKGEVQLVSPFKGEITEETVNDLVPLIRVSDEQ